MPTLMKKKKSLALLTSLGLLCFSGASAAPAIPENPSAAREQAEQTQASTTIENAIPDAAATTSGASFVLQALTVQQEPGLEVKQEKLDRIAAKYVGKTVTIGDLNKAAAEITRYCRAHGYPAATAYLPPQESASGSINIAVAPGRYGNITINNNSTKVKTSAVERLTHGLKQGEVVRGKNLETVLYNIIGLGGVKAGGMLSPGTNNGESDLKILVEDGRQSTYVLYVNNYGSKPAGRYRYGVTADWYELGGNGGHMGVNAMLSNKRQKNFGVRYDQAIGHSGSRLGLGVSHANYELGARLAAFGAEGTATTVSLYGSTPLYRTSNAGSYLSYGLDYRDMTDELTRFGLRTDKNSLAAHVGLNGFLKDSQTTYAYDVKAYAGQLHGDTRVAGVTAPLPQEGSYQKGTIDLSAVHTFAPHWDILLKGSAQLAANDLDTSEEMYLGGAQGVRAYPQGEGSGDSGFLATAELRYHTGVPGLTLSTYFDAGQVTSEGAGADLRDTTLKGWGVGITWSRQNDFFARLDYARRIGSDELMSQDASSRQRVWFLAGKMF